MKISRRTEKRLEKTFLGMGMLTAAAAIIALFVYTFQRMVEVIGVFNANPFGVGLSIIVLIIIIVLTVLFIIYLTAEVVPDEK